MILEYTDIFEHGKTRRIKATVTTTHSASSYGMPVVVLPDGGTLDASSWVMLGYRIVTISKAEAPLMERWLGNLYTTLGVAVNPAAVLGRKGGQAKTEKKAVAARENGKKGGRPKIKK